MNQKVKSIIAGILIGDAGKQRATFYFGHSIKQINFALHKKYLIEKYLGIECSFSVKLNVKYPSVRVYVPVTQIIREMVLQLYGQVKTNAGHKIISRKFLNNLDDESIALWYMDDGSMSIKKRRNGKPHGIEVTLNTYLSTGENQIIIDYFLDVWDIRWGLNKSKNSYRLRMGKTEAKKMFKIINPYVIDSMKYKIYQ